ncbi:signal peptide protein [Paenibacillus sp. SI8]|uniref:signal peptide protein n=1 Tax=unclassified Paenibacillus TaxID=185978 RepID=UPI003465D9AA
MKQQRFWLMAVGFVVIILIIWAVSSAFNSKPSVMNTNSSVDGSGSSMNRISPNSASGEVPWDYQVQEAKVGDLLDGDMVLLPNNERISNDQNFATGDSVWVLRYMSAAMKADSQGKNDVTLSQWKPIKTFKTKEDADKDLLDLKPEIKTEVNLIGVYKTELDGKFRYFAIADLPTGQKIKQPISEERYKSYKDKKQVQVILEEVHDYTNYDQTMAKFRGWAD